MTKYKSIEELAAIDGAQDAYEVGASSAAEYFANERIRIATRAWEHLEVMDFSQALLALKAFRCIRRRGWNGKGLMVFRQVPAHITSDIIPKMQSVPESAKRIIADTANVIDYTNQCLIYNTETGRADSWVPSVSDMFAEDWEVID